MTYGGDNVDDDQIIKTYNAGIDAVIALVKDMHKTLSEQISTLQKDNLRLNNRLAELEARLNKNSSNSSKPPSSDGFKKKTIKNNREITGKSSGGQPGHEGHTLFKVETPDFVVDAPLEEHCNCGCDLTDVEDKTRTRQVFDLPKIEIIVTEYITHEKVCPHCGKVHKTDFPAGVTQPTQYGEKMLTWMNYLTNYQLLPLERAAETINEFTNQTVSEGTLVNANKKLYAALEEAEKVIKEQIIASDVVHFDETGMRSENKTQWLHVAATEKLTYYAFHEKRGAQAAEEIGILPKFNGTALHDHWKPYYTFKDCTHAECNSHNLRYLRDIHDNHGQIWAENMAGLLIEIKRRVDTLKNKGTAQMEPAELETWRIRYHGIIEEGISEDTQKSPKVLSEKTDKPKKGKALNLLLKLRDYDLETLAFMYDFNIPFDNNLAERDLRMQKLRQKISGCFRGKEGAKVFCRIRSYLSTARKNGQGVMESLVKAIRGEPFIPQT